MKLMIEDTGKDKFFTFDDLRNSEELRDEFVEMLKQFDKDYNNYQTDVYLYVDDNMNGTLDTFTNVGGNSWLNDDHYVLYTDKEHYKDWSDFFQTESDIAEALGMSIFTLKQRVLDQINRGRRHRDEMFEIEDITYNDIYYYVNDNGLTDKLYDAISEYIDDNTSDYYDKVDEIIKDFNEKQWEDTNYRDEFE